jgi:NAD(P)H-hydrate epimerase
VTLAEAAELVAVENLARTRALAVLGWAREQSRAGATRVLVFAGRTTAGAAALALARHAHNYGLAQRIHLCGPAHRMLPNVVAQHEILAAMGLDVETAAEAADVRAAVAAAGAADAIVDGSGDANAPGAERDFADAVRSGGGAGLRVKLESGIEYRTGASAAGDARFSPHSAPRSREDVRLLESIAINRYRIGGLALMENAGWRTAREAFAMLGYAKDRGRVVVVAGAGNNGGDGFSAARHLSWWGVDVEVVLVASRQKVIDDARANMEMAEQAGVRIREAIAPEVVGPILSQAFEGAALVVDALVGTGLSGRVRGGVESAIGAINASGAPVLAVDTPSGLDANTGGVLGAAVKASKTVTFAFTKPGFFLGEGRTLVGELVVADISLPRALWVCNEPG